MKSKSLEPCLIETPKPDPLDDEGEDVIDVIKVLAETEIGALLVAGPDQSLENNFGIIHYQSHCLSTILDQHTKMRHLLFDIFKPGNQLI